MGRAARANRARIEAGGEPKGPAVSTPKGRRAWRALPFQVPELGSVVREVDGTFYLVGDGWGGVGGRRRIRAHQDVAACVAALRRQRRERREKAEREAAERDAERRRNAAVEELKAREVPAPEADS